MRTASPGPHAPPKRARPFLASHRLSARFRAADSLPVGGHPHWHDYGGNCHQYYQQQKFHASENDYENRPGTPRPGRNERSEYRPSSRFSHAGLRRLRTIFLARSPFVDRASSEVETPLSKLSSGNRVRRDVCGRFRRRASSVDHDGVQKCRRGRPVRALAVLSPLFSPNGRPQQVRREIGCSCVIGQARPNDS